MRLISFILAFSAAVFAGARPVAAEPTTPDFEIAYALATASYCAYAVGPDFAGRNQLDNGQDLAYRCVKAAAARDPTLAKIGLTTLGKNDVEVYSSGPGGVLAELPGSDSIDGYLLLNTRMGVILAFRGTLLPPVSPDDTADMDRWDLLQKAVVSAAARKAWGAFVSDWLNNGLAQLDDRQRHAGFDASWRRLEAHLDPTCAHAGSSKFCAFIAEKNGARPTLFITGHSKGGAIATLAGLDLAAAQPALMQRVFTFAAAKSVATALATSPAYASRPFWRFERGGDLVPTLPTDDSPPFTALLRQPIINPLQLIPQFSTYAHFGPRVLYVDGDPPSITTPSQGRDAPDDWSRWRSIARIEAPALLKALISKILPSGQQFACPLVTDHLAIFADVQESAWPGGAPPSGVDARAAGFFRYGLRDDDRKSLLPGYEDWCRWLNAI